MGEPPDCDADLNPVKKAWEEGRKVLDFSAILRKFLRNESALVSLLHFVLGRGAANGKLDLSSNVMIDCSMQQLGC